MLEFININKRYGGKLVLNEVSFEIKEGSICGLLGLNGAGKSTFMKVLAGLVFKDFGEIKYFNEKYIKEDNKLNVGFMIESPAFYKNLSGLDNLKLLAILYDKISNDRILEVLKLVGLEKSKKVLVRKYSLGMKQRLYFAYSIINKPKFLILDEPFNGIDPVTCRLFKDLIKKLSLEGVTVLISSHIISDIKETCDKVVILDRGKVVYDNFLNKEDDLEKIFLSKISSDGIAQ